MNNTEVYKTLRIGHDESMKDADHQYREALAAYVKLSRANDTIERRIMGHAPLPAGMSVSQFGVLEALLHKGRLTHHEVARKILKTRGNITSVVDRLEALGLVARRRCDTDRRRVYLELTDRGRTVARSAFERMREAITAEMSVLTPDELVELARLCKKLGTAKRYPPPAGEES